MEHIQISCSFNDEIFNAGEVVTALIRISSYPSNALIFAQAIGIVHIDKRWAKVPPSAVTHEDHAITNFLIPLNIRQNYVSKNIFTTSREPLSISHISDEGVHVQFELPPDALPTFTGLAGIITYLIVISLQFPNDTIRSHFPFRVYGHGTPFSFPHHNPYPLCSFAASSRSYESFISSLTSSVVSLSHNPSVEYLTSNLDQDDDNDEERESRFDFPKDASNKVTFSISDIDTICLMTFFGIDMSLPPSANQASEGLIGSIESGNTMWANINFSSSKQHCEMLKFKLVQRECHHDGTRLQEKTIDEQIRMTSIALNLYFPIRIPLSTPPTFICPAFHVMYVIEIEFYPGPLKSSSLSIPHGLRSIESKEPLLWSVGIKMVPPASSSGGRKCFIPHGSSSQFIDPKSILVENAL